jgi:hypothetical protein
LELVPENHFLQGVIVDDHQITKQINADTQNHGRECLSIAASALGKEICGKKLCQYYCKNQVKT